MSYLNPALQKLRDDAPAIPKFCPYCPPGHHKFPKNANQGVIRHVQHIHADKIGEFRGKYLPHTVQVARVSKEKQTLRPVPLNGHGKSIPLISAMSALVEHHERGQHLWDTIKRATAGEVKQTVKRLKLMKKLMRV